MLVLLYETHLILQKPIPVYEDNTGAIKWASSEKSANHVDLRILFVKDLVAKGHFEFKHYATDEMLTDVLKKPLPSDLFKMLRNLLKFFKGSEGHCRQGGDIDTIRIDAIQN